MLGNVVAAAEHARRKHTHNAQANKPGLWELQRTHVQDPRRRHTNKDVEHTCLCNADECRAALNSGSRCAHLCGTKTALVE